MGMRLYKICLGLLLGVVFLGGVALTKADSPPATATPLPSKGPFEPGPIQAATRSVNWATASVTQMSVLTSAVRLTSTEKIAPLAGPLRPHRLRQSGGDIGPADIYFIGEEDFEGVFPKLDWSRSDDNGTGHLWGDVECYPVEAVFEGFWSGWPASEGINGIDPCVPGAEYPPNLETWLIYGPFSLANAQYADVQFFYRIISEQGVDFLFWGYSTNGNDFSGFETSGTHISGPFNNGYNEEIFDLVPVLGENNVWIGFQFRSNGSIQAQGPFIDFINILIQETGTTKTFLPLLFVSPPPITILRIQNKTSGSVTFTVSGTPQGNITCTVSAGQTKLCGQFTSGTYNATASATACPPPLTKSKQFLPGTITLPVVCK